MKMNSGLASMMFTAALAASAYGCEAEHTPAAKSEGGYQDHNNGRGNQEGQPERNDDYRGLPECDAVDVLRAIKTQTGQIHALVDGCTLELQGEQVTGLGEFDPLKFTYNKEDNRIGISRESVYARSPEHFDPGNYNLATASQLDPYGNAVMDWGFDEEFRYPNKAWQVSYNGDQILVYDAQVGPDGAFHPGTVCLSDQETAYVFGFNTYGDLVSACQQSVSPEKFHDLASGIHGRNEEVYQLFAQ